MWIFEATRTFMRWMSSFVQYLWYDRWWNPTFVGVFNPYASPSFHSGKLLKLLWINALVRRGLSNYPDEKISTSIDCNDVVYHYAIRSSFHEACCVSTQPCERKKPLNSQTAFVLTNFSKLENHPAMNISVLVSSAPDSNATEAFVYRIVCRTFNGSFAIEVISV